MAEEFIEEIYAEAKLLFLLKQIREYADLGYTHSIILKLNEILPKLGEVSKKYANTEGNTGVSLWKSLEKLTGYTGDNAWLSGLLEREVIPAYLRCLVNNNVIEIDDEEGHLLISTDSSFLTVKDVQSNTFWHSTFDPMWEAYEKAKAIFEPEKDCYVLYGCGLGYLPYQLYLLTRGSAKIIIYEPDAKMAEYARLFGVLDWISDSVLELHLCNTSVDFLQASLKENTGLYIMPLVCQKLEENEKQVIKQLADDRCTSATFTIDKKINFYRNIRSNAKLITEFVPKNIKRKVLVVAAGPSLDQTIEFINKNREQFTLIAVGTVFKKLLALRITPDFVAVNDPQERTYKQIEGVEDVAIPMFLGVLAYWEFAAKYAGPKYLITTMSTRDIAGDWIERNGQTPWFCGGTVTAMALAVAQHMNPEEIYFAGVDLAYPMGLSHAENTMDRKKVNTDQMMRVPGTTEESVFTDIVFYRYRLEMEQMIDKVPNIKYYNLSKIGAKIKGTIYFNAEDDIP